MTLSMTILRIKKRKRTKTTNMLTKYNIGSSRWRISVTFCREWQHIFSVFLWVVVPIINITIALAFHLTRISSETTFISDKFDWLQIQMLVLICITSLQPKGANTKYGRVWAYFSVKYIWRKRFHFIWRIVNFPFEGLYSEITVHDD